MNVVLSHYEPYIARLSMRTSIDEYGNPHTTVDEDMRSRLEAKLIEQVLNFKGSVKLRPITERRITPFLRPLWDLYIFQSLYIFVFIWALTGV